MENTEIIVIYKKATEKQLQSDKWIIYATQSDSMEVDNKIR